MIAQHTRDPKRHKQRLLSVIVGLIAGFGGGLASLGGGTLLIPQLTGFLRLNPLDARGTSLAVALINAMTGTVIYAAADRVAWSPLLWAGLPAMLVAPLASRLSINWPDRGLRIAFGLVVIFGGIALLAVGAKPPVGFARTFMDVYLIIVGLLAGAVAGIVGVSGGPVLAPLFVLGLGMPQALAQGSSLLTRLPATLSGLWENARERHVRWDILPWLAVGGLCGAVMGSRLALALPEHTLRILFAGLLIVLGLFEIFNRPGHHLPWHHHHHDPYP